MVERTPGSHHKDGATKMAKTNTKVAGIDTAKATLDMAVHGRTEHWQVDNTPAGWRELSELLTAQRVGRIGIEATGGYEVGVIAALRAAGFTVIRHQPVQISAFARMRLRRAKTDRLDAALIAHFTALFTDDRPAPDPRFAAFALHLTHIEQLEGRIKQTKTFLEHQSEPRLRRQWESRLKADQKEAAYELALLVKALRQQPDLDRRLELLLSIDGIGLRTAVALVVGMPELGQISREEAAALAGLAPFVRQSGKWAGEAHIDGGRARVRTALYAAALPAAFQWNPALIAFYARLKQAGKSHKKALVACARKLLIFANSVLQRDTPWRKAATQS
ncbi:IS110 family transposase [Phreatobacter sp. AB_2022a]|uniref:IS110 family transposase n=1 Tax=Phreatobacter sp. AB_2022a TaxID=3003134 RepID=UPI002287499C|nr:IS110 family transposase [Phreatobacter sp. AB_2022a]MCZ0733181.1 IS110 family transposase [Phreatobacter sp. AB_2022a]